MYYIISMTAGGFIGEGGVYVTDVERAKEFSWAQARRLCHSALSPEGHMDRFPISAEAVRLAKLAPFGDEVTSS